MLLAACKRLNSSQAVMLTLRESSIGLANKHPGPDSLVSMVHALERREHEIESSRRALHEKERNADDVDEQSRRHGLSLSQR
jgi:hypothetical protein